MLNQKRMKIGVSIAIVIIAICAFQRKSDALELPKLVETNESKRFAGGSHVGVDLPLIFKMNLDTRANHSGVLMNLNILKGLVHVFVDRARDADGKNKGPIKVDIEGMTIYDNDEAST